MSVWALIYWLVFFVAVYLYVVGSEKLACDIAFADVVLILLPKNFN